MFKGSPNVPEGMIDNLIEDAGGWSNAATAQDSTVYEDLASPAFLERALWIEGDRISRLADALDQTKLDNQRDVVLNEKRESIENRPYGMAEILIPEALWPEGHPYHAPIIGYTPDLNAATVADAQAFFRSYYSPSNAVMAIAGDFDPATARALVEKYLAWIPAAKTPPRRPVVATPKPITQEIDLATTDDVSATRVYITWRAPKTMDKDEAVLDTAAEILGSGKSSRLYKKLVMEQRIAQEVYAANEAQQLAGEFQIVATVKPGVEPEKVIRAIDAELAELAKNGPSAEELEKVKNSREASFFQLLAEPMSRARQLLSYDIESGDPDYMDKDLARYRAVTDADVRRAVTRWLGDHCRVVLTISPGAKQP
jgi:zinc protease